MTINSKSFLIATIASVFALPAFAEGWSIEAYGGSRLAGEMVYDSADADYEPGVFMGASVYYNLSDNFDIGLDISHTKAETVGSGTNDGMSSKAIMASARYSKPLGGKFSAFGHLGLGAVDVTRVNAGGTTDAGGYTLGGQVGIGVAYHIQSKFSIFAEARHQRTFDIVNTDGDYNMGYKSNNILFGVRAGF